jgi:hypothetical protein
VQFDKASWLEAIKRPNWYIRFNDFADKAKLKTESDSKSQEELNKQVRHFFEGALQSQQVSLGSDGHNFDSERQPIDTVVLHHTSAKPGYKLSYLKE